MAEMASISSGEPPNLDSRLRGNDGCSKVSESGNPSSARVHVQPARAPRYAPMKHRRYSGLTGSYGYETSNPTACTHRHRRHPLALGAPCTVTARRLFNAPATVALYEPPLALYGRTVTHDRSPCTPLAPSPHDRSPCTPLAPSPNDRSPCTPLRTVTARPLALYAPTHRHRTTARPVRPVAPSPPTRPERPRRTVAERPLALYAPAHRHRTTARPVRPYAPSPHDRSPCTPPRTVTARPLALYAPRTVAARPLALYAPCAPSPHDRSPCTPLRTVTVRPLALYAPTRRRRTTARPERPRRTVVTHSPWVPSTRPLTYNRSP